MKIKKGKTYRDGFGDEVKILKANAKEIYPVIGLKTTVRRAMKYSLKGKLLKCDKDMYDLIQEVKPA